MMDGFWALSTIPATDPSATGFGIPQNPDASAWRRCPTPGTGKSQFPPLPAFLKHPLRKYCEKNEPYTPQMLSVGAYQPGFVCTCSGRVGVRLENGNYPTLRLYFVQQWRRMRDQQFINRDSFLLKRLNGSFYINRIPECYRRRM